MSNQVWILTIFDFYSPRSWNRCIRNNNGSKWKTMFFHSVIQSQNNNAVAHNLIEICYYCYERGGYPPLSIVIILFQNFLESPNHINFMMDHSRCCFEYSRNLFANVIFATRGDRAFWKQLENDYSSDTISQLINSWLRDTIIVISIIIFTTRIVP